MRVLQVVEVQLEWSDLDNLIYHERGDMQRSVGLHVSDVLRHVAIESKMYTEEDREDAMPLRIMLGLAFEEYAARLNARLWWQPGEFVLDDGIEEPVYGSPDGIEEASDAQWDVHEYKYSGKSMRTKGGKATELKDIRTEWLWMQQGMSYVNMLRERGLKSSRCWFHICWKYGVYEFPMKERYYKYLVEFEARELEGNRMMMRNGIRA